MKLRALALVALCASARAASSDPVADALRRALAVAPSRAVEDLRNEASSDPAAKEVFASLFDADARRELESRLKPDDADGSLRGELEALARALPKPDKAVKAADSILDKRPPDVRLNSPEDDADEFSSAVDVGAGIAASGRRAAPALAARGDVGYQSGPWHAGLEADGQGSAGGGRDRDVGRLDAELDRKIGDSKNFVFAEAEAERDGLLGMKLERAARIGIGREILDSTRQALTVAVGVGPDVEGTFRGSERSLSPTLEADYTLHLNPVWSVVESFEAEFNAKDANDVEYSSVTKVVWNLSEKFAVQATEDFKERTERVVGCAKSRSTALLGVHYDF